MQFEVVKSVEVIKGSMVGKHCAGEWGNIEIDIPDVTELNYQSLSTKAFVKRRQKASRYLSY